MEILHASEFGVISIMGETIVAIPLLPYVMDNITFFRFFFFMNLVSAAMLGAALMIWSEQFRENVYNTMIRIITLCMKKKRKRKIKRTQNRFTKVIIKKDSNISRKTENVRTLF